jgi:hypothetical protein
MIRRAILILAFLLAGCSALGVAPSPTATSAAALQQRITDEIFFALGFGKTGLMRRLFGWMFLLPTLRFARIFAGADAEIAQRGLSAGCRWILPSFSINLTVSGAENLPEKGPLLIVSNHPGAYDSVALGSCVLRPDLKIVVWETPFYHALTHADRWFIHAPPDPTGRMLALRACLEHLQGGGSLLLFGTGKIEPDPSLLPGADKAIEQWSTSVEVMLRKVPAAQLVCAIASGIMQPAFSHSPLTRIHKDPIDQRRLAEFMQVIWQLVFPKSFQPHIRLSFALPVTGADLWAANPGPRLLPAVQRRALALLEEHVQRAAADQESPL